MVSDTLRELPGEGDYFEKIRTQNKVYVDKTSYIMKLLQSEYRFFRMCRPGRFGKSNFLQTLNSFFQGNKTLFDGLAIHDANHDWQAYPVIYFDFSETKATCYSVDKTVSSTVLQTAKSYGIEIDEENLPDVMMQSEEICELILAGRANETVEFCTNKTQLGYLIESLSKNSISRSVVVLIDEYDWPVRQHFENDFLLGNMQPLMKRFFMQFAIMESRIKFLFMIGTTKLDISPFYTAKNYFDISAMIKDISFDPEFNEMIGLTDKELWSDHFKSHINALLIANPNETFHTIVQKMRKRYNGYCFSPWNTISENKPRLYNFHSVISCLRENKTNYSWHPAGCPKQNVIFRRDYPTYIYPRIHIFDNFTISRQSLEKSYSTRDDFIPREVYMIANGFVTLLDYNKKTDEFIVGFTNDEMRESFAKEVMKYLPGREKSLASFLDKCKNLRESLLVRKADKFIEDFESLTCKYCENNSDFPKPCHYDAHLVFDACEITNNRVLGHGYTSEIIECANGLKYMFGFETEGANIEWLVKHWIERVDSQKKYKSPDSTIINLMVINFDENCESITEWIMVTHVNYTIIDFQTSETRFAKMYENVTNLHSFIRTAN